MRNIFTVERPCSWQINWHHSFQLSFCNTQICCKTLLYRKKCFNLENQHGLFLTCLYFLPNQVKCPQCKTRNLRLWPPAPDIQLACSEPTCRLLGDGYYMKSDGKNTYMCFQCCFILCTTCVELYFGRTSLEQGNFPVDIGDELLKLPPSYNVSRVLNLQQPPSYEQCISVQSNLRE